MDSVGWPRIILSFIFVLGLLGLTAVVLKRSALAKQMIARKMNQRLSVVESHYIDSRRKLVLIKRDDKEHLLLLAPDMQTVIETGIESKADKKDE